MKAIALSKVDFTRFARQVSTSKLQQLEGHRAELIQVAMTPLAIVEHFDVLKNL